MARRKRTHLPLPSAEQLSAQLEQCLEIETREATITEVNSMPSLRSVKTVTTEMHPFTPATKRVKVSETLEVLQHGGAQGEGDSNEIGKGGEEATTEKQKSQVRRYLFRAKEFILTLA
jgi:hypothetical protein